MMAKRQAILIHDFVYESKGRKVDLKKGEQFILITPIDDKWWRIKRLNDFGTEYQVPASHIKIINDNPLDSVDDDFADVEDLEDYDDLIEQAKFSVNRARQIVSIDSASEKYDFLDNDKEFSDEAFGSSHGSLDKIDDLVDDPKFSENHIIQVGQEEKQIVAMKPPQPTGEPIFKPRRFQRQQPVYANVTPLKQPQQQRQSKDHLEAFKKFDPPLIDNNPNVRVKRWVCDQWFEYFDEEGRLFYYNSEKKISSWKPPRRTTKVDAQDVDIALQQQQQQQASSINYQSDTEVVLSHGVKQIVQNFNDDDLLLSNLRRNSSFKQSNKIKRNKIPKPSSLASSTTSSGGDDDVSSVSGIAAAGHLHRPHHNHNRHYNNNISKQSSKHQPPSLTKNDSTDNPLVTIMNLLKLYPPEEWQRNIDQQTNEVYFVTKNEMFSKKWFCGKDGKGRIYFYENRRPPPPPPPMATGKHSDASTITSNIINNNQSMDGKSSKEDFGYLDFSDENDQQKPKDLQLAPSDRNTIQNHERTLRTQSMISTAMISSPIDSTQQDQIRLVQGAIKHSSPFQEYKELVPPPPNKLELSDIILHDSLIQTRTIISGKNKGKKWTTSYVVLTQYYMYFFKDQKNMFLPSKCDFVMGLLNAKVEWCTSESSKKNCFKINTFQNQTLLQDDDRQKSLKWVEHIDDCIGKLTPIENIPNNYGDEISFRRSRSAKHTNRRVGIDFIGGNPSGSSTIGGYTKFTPSQPQQHHHSSPTNDKRKKIRDRLLNFLKKRPPVESLREKGIIKDENIFGCTLELICQREKTNIPRFVHECVQAIEKNDITADGIYRACGNLSTVQKLRFEINQENYQGLWKETDVHVLTGLLKMFFREMKEPLFPFDRFENLIKLIGVEDKNRNYKIVEFKRLVMDLPEPNFYTLKFILEHLLRVTKYSKQNRMHIQNLAIVFGPTLLRKLNDLNNLVIDMMLQVHQSRIIEFLLEEYSSIFEV